MPKFDQAAHESLMSAGYDYDAINDKYFNRNPPIWEVSEKMASGIKQGAWPSKTVEEFRSQEREWVANQWSKILAMKTEQ